MTDVQPDPVTNRVVVTFTDLPERVITDRLADAGFGVRRTVTDDEPGQLKAEGTADGRSRYGLLVLGIAVIAVAGYAGYVLYPRFDLPALEGAGLLTRRRGRGSLRSSHPVRSRCWSPCCHGKLATTGGAVRWCSLLLWPAAPRCS